MIFVSQEDVLRGLKKCKRLAKQAILASGLMPDPSFWTLQAEARRATYDQLMERVERLGVEPAYAEAVEEYNGLDDSEAEPMESGKRQALNMFFTILGVDRDDSATAPSEIAAMEIGEAQSTLS